MANIDNMLKKVLGKGKNKRQSLGFNINKILGKPLKGKSTRTSFGSKSILGKPLLKPRLGASSFMQQKWKSFSPNFKKVLRKRLPDTDGDRVPDMFDCAPRNVMRQDEEEMFLTALKEANNGKDITFSKPMFVITTFVATDGREEGCGSPGEIEKLLKILGIKYKEYNLERTNEEEYGDSGDIYIYVIDISNDKDLRMLKNALKDSKKDIIKINNEDIMIDDSYTQEFDLHPGRPLYKNAWEEWEV